MIFRFMMVTESESHHWPGVGLYVASKQQQVVESPRFVARTCLPLNVLCIIHTDVETSTVQELVERGLRDICQY